MNHCRLCARGFSEEEHKKQGILDELWRIFLACSVNININTLCSECRKQMDMCTLLEMRK